MVMEDKIDLKSLNLEELSGVISIYPWYGGARMEMCRRMASAGFVSPDDSRFAETALYVGSRTLLSNLLSSARSSEPGERQMFRRNIGGKPASPAVVIAGGDYFSRAQYEGVKQSSDGIFATFARSGCQSAESAPGGELPSLDDFCTETLAGIYLEQGYPGRAKEIYSKLSLRYPEKSVYFAALIDKIKD